MICAEALESSAHMMIDIGAGRNLIIQNSVNPELPIGEKIVLKIVLKPLKTYPLKLYPFESTQILTIPTRIVRTFYITIENTEKSEGYIPRLNISEETYATGANLKNCKGKAYIKFANTNEIPVTISIPTITLGDFEERDAQELTRQSRNIKT